PDNMRPVSRDYGFSARDGKGRRRTGILSAGSHVEATRQLRDQGLFPIEINAVEGAGAAQPKKERRAFFKKSTTSHRLSARQKADFVARLAKLAGARISIDRALRIMAEGEAGAIATAAQKLRMHIREGGGFADGVEAATGIDDTASLALIRGAESSGELDVALATAAGILEQRLMVARRVVTGLLYPSLLLIVSIISVGVIMIAIIPQFRPLVEERMEFVPVLGRAVFALSGTLAALWPVLLTAFVGLVAAMVWLHRKGKAGAIVSRVAMRLPMVRDLLERNHAMMALHILGALLRRDVTLSEALRVVGETSPPGRIRKAIKDVSRSVADGAPLAASFAKTKIFAPSAVEMLRIGEETGALEDMATRAATEMREASDRALERFLALFQPAMIVIVGTLVGVSLYALFSAIIAVNQVAF
ncbi:MAG: type II secretion system F family protein, partial [Pseudomonadota bacterium]